MTNEQERIDHLAMNPEYHKIAQRKKDIYCRAAMSEANSLAANVPAGYKLVPIEPTEEILRALTDPFIAINGDNRKAFAKAWAAMLAAAPACTCPSGDGSLRWPCPEHPAPAPEADLLCRLMAHGVVHHTGDDERLTCTQEQAAKAMLDVLGFDVEWASPATEAAPAQAQQAAELLPCPFCGSHVIAREGYHMTCLTCGAEGTDADEATDNAAAAAWNRRAKAKPEAQQPLSDAELDALMGPGQEFVAELPSGSIISVHAAYGRSQGREAMRAAIGAVRGIGASGEASK